MPLCVLGPADITGHRRTPCGVGCHGRNGLMMQQTDKGIKLLHNESARSSQLQTFKLQGGNCDDAPCAYFFNSETHWDRGVFAVNCVPSGSRRIGTTPRPRRRRRAHRQRTACRRSSRSGSAEIQPESCDFAASIFAPPLFAGNPHPGFQ